MTLREALLRARAEAEGEGTVTVYNACVGPPCRAPDCACARIVIEPDDPRSLEEIMASLTVN